METDLRNSSGSHPSRSFISAHHTLHPCSIRIKNIKDIASTPEYVWSSYGLLNSHSKWEKYQSQESSATEELLLPFCSLGTRTLKWQASTKSSLSLSLPFSFPPHNVHVCVHIYKCVWMCMHVCVPECRGQMLVLGVFLYSEFKSNLVNKNCCVL